MRAHGKHQLVVAIVNGALDREGVFNEQVQAVREGVSPLEIASRYGNGQKRREAIARLLDLAARDPSGYSSDNAAGVVAFTVDDTATGPPNAFSESFRLLIWTGARAIARRGAGKCLECGVPLVGGAKSHTGRSARRDHCARHDHLPEPTEVIRETFDRLSAALAVGAALEVEHVEQPPPPSGPLPEPWSLAKREAWLATRDTT